MKLLLIGIAAASLIAGTSPDSSAQTPGTADRSDGVERAYLRILAEDDAAQEEADRWIREAREAEARGSTIPMTTLTGRIEQRFAPVRKAYEDFLRENPNHVRARLAYGSFLHDTHDEEEGVQQWEKAKEIDPKNPAVWNNLANHYGHRGPVKKAFEHYAKAIELDPEEPVYLQNFATTVYLFRRDAMEHFNIDEPEVFNRALELYRKAIKLDPDNFILASDYAQSYYGIKPLRAEAAIAAWEYALKLANDDIEREGVHLHLARVNLNSGRFAEARKHLDAVKHEMHGVLKNRLARNLAQKEKQAQDEARESANLR